MHCPNSGASLRAAPPARPTGAPRGADDATLVSIQNPVYCLIRERPRRPLPHPQRPRRPAAGRPAPAPRAGHPPAPCARLRRGAGLRERNRPGRPPATGGCRGDLHDRARPPGDLPRPFGPHRPVAAVRAGDPARGHAAPLLAQVRGAGDRPAQRLRGGGRTVRDHVHAGRRSPHRRPAGGQGRPGGAVALRRRPADRRASGGTGGRSRPRHLRRRARHARTARGRPGFAGAPGGDRPRLGGSADARGAGVRRPGGHRVAGGLLYAAARPVRAERGGRDRLEPRRGAGPARARRRCGAARRRGHPGTGAAQLHRRRDRPDRGSEGARRRPRVARPLDGDTTAE